MLEKQLTTEKQDSLVKTASENFLWKNTLRKTMTLLENNTACSESRLSLTFREDLFLEFAICKLNCLLQISKSNFVKNNVLSVS